MSCENALIRCKELKVLILLIFSLAKFSYGLYTVVGLFYNVFVIRASFLKYFCGFSNGNIIFP